MKTHNNRWDDQTNSGVIKYRDVIGYDDLGRSVPVFQAFMWYHEAEKETHDTQDNSEHKN